MPALLRFLANLFCKFIFGVSCIVYAPGSGGGVRAENCFVREIGCGYYVVFGIRSPALLVINKKTIDLSTIANRGPLFVKACGRQKQQWYVNVSHLFISRVGCILSPFSTALPNECLVSFDQDLEPLLDIIERKKYWLCGPKILVIEPKNGLTIGNCIAIKSALPDMIHCNHLSTIRTNFISVNSS